MSGKFMLPESLVAVSTRTPIAEALSQLSDAHRRLASEIELAEVKFAMVLVPMPPRPENKDVEGPRESELHGIIMSAAAFANNMADELQSINNRSTL